jgi:rhamnulokinase
VDLGAQSCRVSLLRWSSEGPQIQQVYRRANAPIESKGQLRWDLAALCATVDEGLRRCAAIADEGIAAIGVTGWAVDYLRLDAQGHPVAEPFCYRDARTAQAMEAVHRHIPPERLYALTGIQVLALNTLYQLYADGMAGIPRGNRWLNLPEYMLYRWGARPVAEYTNATCTAMVALNDAQWCAEIFAATGMDPAAAPEIVPPGSIVGRLQGPLSQLPALRDTLLVAPACHDTASAIAGIPAQGEDWAYISSGTWSLVGTLLEHPCAGPDAARLNFTNEGGVGGRRCFLRNVNGLWLLEECLKHWQAEGEHWTWDALLEAASQLPTPEVLLDVDDPELLQPGNMPGRIVAQLARRQEGTAVPRNTAPAITRLVLHSLAARYATVLHQAARLTGRDLTRLFIVGGGSKNALLNHLTQQATGMELSCGPVESTTLGNFAVQLAALERGLTHADGVSHHAVLHWAKELAHPFIQTPSATALSLHSAKHLPEVEQS